MKQIAKWVKPEALPAQKDSEIGYDKHTIFPLWEEGMSWDEFKTEINIYKKASTKNPAGKFLDMIHALKASKKINISKRLSKSLEAEMSADNIIDKAVKYIETHFGETPIERNDKAMEAMQTLRRDKDEDMSEFIQRFEGVMEQLKVVRFELEGRLEAALLHRTANLTKQEANNVSSKVDMASNDTDLVSKLKAALRQVGFRKEGNLEVKNEVVLQAETIEEITPDQGTDDAYYGNQPQH